MCTGMIPIVHVCDWSWDIFPHDNQESRRTVCWVKKYLLWLGEALAQVLILGAWEVRRLLINSHGFKLTAPTMRLWVATAASRGLSSVSPVWEDCRAPLVLSATPAAPAEGITGGVIFKSRGQRHSQRRTRNARADGLVAWLAGSSTWGAGAGPSHPVCCCWWSDTHLWQWTITCKLFQMAGISSLPTAFSPLHSIAHYPKNPSI